MTLWQGSRGLLHAPAHEMVLADGSLQRGVKNGSEGHCLGTLEKKGFAARRAPWQAAPWSQQKSTGYIFLLVGTVAGPKLRAPAKGRVQLLPCCCLDRVGDTPSLLSPHSTRAASVAFLAHGRGRSQVPTASLGSGLQGQHGCTSKTVSQEQLVSVGAE